VKDCFKQGEIAQLLLIKKQTKNMLVSESEKKSIQPKGAKRKKAGGGKIDLDRVDAIGRMSSNFDGELRKMSGIYMLLKLRDLKPSEHHNKIKLRDIILFTVLAILTIVSYVSRRPPSQEFLLVEGIKAELLPARYDEAEKLSSPAFADIHTVDQVWQWLTTTMPLGLYDPMSVLRKYNVLMGYVQIRQQSVGFPPSRVGFCQADVAPVIEALQTLGSVGTPLRQPGCDEKVADSSLPSGVRVIEGKKTPSGLACPNLNSAGTVDVRVESVRRGTSFKITREQAEAGEGIDIDFDGPATISIQMLELGTWDPSPLRHGILALTKSGENGARFYYTMKTVEEYRQKGFLVNDLPPDTDIEPGKYNLQWQAANVTGPDNLPKDEIQGFQLTIAPTGPRCFAQEYDSSTADTSEYGSLKDYWTNTDPNEQGGEVRGPSNPGVYEDSKTNNQKRRITNIVGYNQEYDASGFSVDYKLQVMDLKNSKQVVVEDMKKFKDLMWFSIRTRLVVVSFSLYNFQYDKWCAVDMLFELPPSGTVRTASIIRPFKPTLEETTSEMKEVYIDYVRCLIGIFIFVFIRADEIRHKEKNHKGGYQYILSLNGISDALIELTVIILTIVRKVAFHTQTTPEWVGELNRLPQPQGDSPGFISLSNEAYIHEQVQVLEGILFLANMARILSFLRLNHKVFMLWHTIGEALKMFVYFCALFCPVFIGFCILAHSIYAPYCPGWDTVSEAMLSLMEFMKGSLEYEKMTANDQVWSAVFFVLFFLIVTFCLLNIFTAILIDAYYVVALTAGFDPKEYQWRTSKWLSWACPSLFFNFIMELQRPATDTG
jgi:hypothetical protein